MSCSPKIVWFSQCFQRVLFRFFFNISRIFLIILRCSWGNLPENVYVKILLLTLIEKFPRTCDFCLIIADRQVHVGITLSTCPVNPSVCCPQRWRRGSRLDCESDDPGLNPGLPLPRVGPLMARRLKTSSDVPVLVSG